MVETILQTLYLFLPALVANMCPVIFQWVPIAGKPISTKYLGSHKTYRGFIVGYLGALLVIFAQSKLSTPYDLLNYETINIFLYAAIFGIGAIAGDMIKSFFKRLLKIKPGSPFVPFDQIDFILGSTLLLLPFYTPECKILFTALVITPVVHFLTNVIGYWIGLKKVWW